MGPGPLRSLGFRVSGLFVGSRVSRFGWFGAHWGLGRFGVRGCGFKSGGFGA